MNAHDGAASPFHEGEQHLQSLTGKRERMEAVGQQVIRNHMPDQHRDFFAQLPFVIVGGLDAQRQPWATMWSGEPGFLHSPEPTCLQVRGPHFAAGDPLAGAWQDTSASPWPAQRPIGLLGIEPHTRRRNRLNGTLMSVGEQSWAVQVRQSFGNCPKYIQPRELHWRAPARPAPPPEAALEQGMLTPRARQIIAQADTFFIATASPRAGLADQQRSDGVDVSHRGGAPGFVHIDDNDALHSHLLVPDYSGNFMFNTLGNIVLQPRVGLLFIEFASGAMLWLAGQATIDLDSPRVATIEGAQRLLRVQVMQGHLAEAAAPLACVDLAG